MKLLIAAEGPFRRRRPPLSLFFCSFFFLFVRGQSASTGFSGFPSSSSSLCCLAGGKNKPRPRQAEPLAAYFQVSLPPPCCGKEAAISPLLPPALISKAKVCPLRGGKGLGATLSAEERKPTSWPCEEVPSNFFSLLEPALRRCQGGRCSIFSLAFRISKFIPIV